MLLSSRWSDKPSEADIVVRELECLFRVGSRRWVATDGFHRLNGGRRPVLLKNSGSPADACESKRRWRGEVPQIVFRGIKVQSNALSAPLATG